MKGISLTIPFIKRNYLFRIIVAFISQSCIEITAYTCTIFDPLSEII